MTLAHAIGRACCVLTGNLDTGVVPPGYYGRLCADLAALDVPVIADLHGSELAEVLRCGAVQLVKVSDEALRADGLLDDDSEECLVEAVTDLARSVAQDLVVTQGPQRPAAARLGAVWFRVNPPRLAAVDWRGAGDAMVGAMAVAHLRGGEPAERLRFGAAAGAASVTRRGLASLDAELVEALAPHVSVVPVDGVAEALRGPADPHRATG